MHTFWVTFYSYKGGVGRSMALANVAALLAKNGRRVMMVDFDLEAPGLDSFEEFHVEEGSAGMVEYVTTYLEAEKAPRVSSFVQEVAPSETMSGKLWLMTAGRKDEAYNRKRVAINWTEFYEHQGGALFFENFKADIEDTFRPDYVFVDSRTGLTDVGGVCTLHLPDLVVLLFSLNEQNLQGIASVARVLRNADKAPQLLPVATPVPNLPRDSKSLVDERYQRARELLGVEVGLSIAYSPQMSLRERVYAWGGGGTLVSQYEQLRRSISEADPEGLDYLIRQADHAITAYDLVRGQEIEESLRLEYGDRSDSWLRIAEIRKVNGSVDGYELALRKSLELDPSNETAFQRIDSLLSSKKRHQELIEIIEGLLSNSGTFSSEWRSNLSHSAGLILMHQGRAKEALSYFEAGLDSVRFDDSVVSLLIAHFNVAEAARRSAMLQQVDWELIITIFESAAAGVNSSGLPERLNYLQAMHVPYACVGKLDQARELLDEVAKLAQHVSSRERIFCVGIYERLSKDEFLEFNRRMREALDRGELWDGMKLAPVR